MEGVDACKGGYAAIRGAGGRWEVRRPDGAPFFISAPSPELLGVLERIELGESPTDEDLDALESESAFEACASAARAFCARAEQSTGGLARKLSAKGHGGKAIKRAIEAMVSAGFVDDARFCRAWIASRENKAEGPRRVEAGLIARGVPRELAREASRAMSEDEIERRLRAALRKYERRGCIGINLKEQLKEEGFPSSFIHTVLNERNA